MLRRLGEERVEITIVVISDFAIGSRARHLNWMLSDMETIVALCATATMRPWLSSSGSVLMLELSRALSSLALVPSVAEQQLVFMAAVTGGSGQSRRCYPAAEVAVGEHSLQDAAFRDHKDQCDLLAVILLSAERMLSSRRRQTV